MLQNLLGNFCWDGLFKKDDNSWLVIALVIIVIVSLLGRDKKKDYC